MQSRCEEEAGKLLKKAGIRFSRLSEIPLATIRHTQRGAFPDMRMAHLAANLRDESLARPVLRDLLCTRVGFQGPSPAHYIPRHAGSYDCILIYCTAGRGWLEIEGQELIVEKHNAFLIPRHVPHAYGADPSDPWSNYWVHFQGEQAPAFTKLVACGSASPVMHLPVRQEMVAGIEQIYLHMSNVHTYPTLIAASGALSQLLGTIQLRMQSSGQRSRTADENLEKSIEFMQRNLSRKLTLKYLANIARMSPNHYGVLFKKRYENSPIDYFNRQKIQRACELLSTTGMRISEIGESLGFPDPYYFSRLFKKVQGVPPSDYRQFT